MQGTLRVHRHILVFALALLSFVMKSTFAYCGGVAVVFTGNDSVDLRIGYEPPGYYATIYRNNEPIQSVPSGSGYYYYTDTGLVKGTSYTYNYKEFCGQAYCPANSGGYKQYGDLVYTGDYPQTTIAGQISGKLYGSHTWSGGEWSLSGDVYYYNGLTIEPSTTIISNGHRIGVELYDTYWSSGQVLGLTIDGATIKGNGVISGGGPVSIKNTSFMNPDVTPIYIYIGDYQGSAGLFQGNTGDANVDLHAYPWQSPWQGNLTISDNTITQLTIDIATNDAENLLIENNTLSSINFTQNSAIGFNGNTVIRNNVITSTSAPAMVTLNFQKGDGNLLLEGNSGDFQVNLKNMVSPPDALDYKRQVRNNRGIRGIYLENVYRTLIEENEITRPASENSRITYGYCHGMEVQQGIANLIRKNKITNLGTGVCYYDFESQSGIYLKRSYSTQVDSSDNRVSDNVIKNFSTGLRLDFAKNNEIHSNTFQYNGYSLVLADLATGNKIYNNLFASKNQDANLFLASLLSSNIWNQDRAAGPNIIGGPYIGGNYWSKYTGIDADRDGFWDAPYKVNNFNNNNIDNLPLAVDIIVNTNGDEEDGDLNDSRCDIDLITPGDQCTLRAAIQETNKRSGRQIIFFNIPGSGTPVISPAKPLPDIIEEVTFDIALQPGGKAIIDGTNAGTKSNGLTIINGDVSLKGLTIRNFTGNGIDARGAGYVLLENVDLQKNGSYGVIAEKDVFLNVKPVYSLQNTHRMLNTIAMNGTDLNGGGIRSKAGAIVGAWIDVNNNSGPGIIAHGKITLSAVKSNNNSGPGIQSLRGFVSMQHDGGFGIPQVNENEGHGIVSGSSNTLAAGNGMGIGIGTSIEVRNNAGWGILSSLTDALSSSNEAVGILINTDNAVLLTNDASYIIGSGNTEKLFITNGTSYITGNGNTAKRLLTIGEDGIMTLHGGGSNMAVRGGIGSLNYIAADRIEVSGNNGPGIVARRNIKLSGVRSSNNNGPGIQSMRAGVWMLHDGGFGTSQVNENEGHGIVSGCSNTLEACGGRGVGIGTSIEVRNNAGWGILSSLTDALSNSNQAVGIVINVDGATRLTPATSYITGNGNTSKRLFTVWPDGSMTQNSGSNNWQMRGGLGSLNYLAAYRIEVSGNNGPGIVARQTISLSGVKANGNSGVGLQSLRDKIGIALDPEFASQGCYNKGGNIITARGINGAENITFCDSDSDGISDDIEAAAPNNGDGNGDGIPDSQQMNVASFMAFEKYLTVASASGTEIVGVAATGGGVPASAVQGISFPAGFIQYKVNMTPQRTTQAVPQQAATTTVTHILPEGTTMNSYWLHGPTRDNPADHWYAFMYDGTTGAEIQGNKLILHFVDGLRGDSDLTENGEIVLSPGGPVNLENGAMDLANAILVLQIMTQTEKPLYPSLPISDINRDGKIGLAEALNILQSVAGMRD